MTKAAFRISQAKGSDVVEDFALTEDARDSMERRSPVQVLHRSAAAPPPGQADNAERVLLAEELAVSGNSLEQPRLTLHRERPETSRFKALQMYEGTVQEVFDTGFAAVLRDTSSPGEPEQVATIEFEHVSDSDRALVAPGAVFYWSIGYQVKPHGQRVAVGIIRFRRLPAWTATDLSQARAYARSLDDLFDSSEQ